jgi:hypothetical protein
MCDKILPYLINVFSFKLLIDLKLSILYIIQFLAFIFLAFIFIYYNICLKYLLSMHSITTFLLIIARLANEPQELNSLFFGKKYHCTNIVLTLTYAIGSLLFSC